MCNFFKVLLGRMVDWKSESKTELNKLAKARKMRKLTGTLGLKKFWPGNFWVKKFGPKTLRNLKTNWKSWGQIEKVEDKYRESWGKTEKVGEKSEKLRKSW